LGNVDVLAPLIDRHILCTKDVLGSVLARLFGGLRLFSDVLAAEFLHGNQV
jgi:hypothetical protein